MLEVLNIFHSSSMPDEQRQWMDESVYKTITQGMAKDIFKKLAMSHPLKVLAFGKKFIFGDSLEAQSCRHPIRQCYLRAGFPEFKARGDDGSEAIRVDPGELKYYYPDSEILDYRFELMAEDQA